MRFESMLFDIPPKKATKIFLPTFLKKMTGFSIEKHKVLLKNLRVLPDVPKTPVPSPGVQCTYNIVPVVEVLPLRNKCAEWKTVKWRCLKFLCESALLARRCC